MEIDDSLDNKIHMLEPIKRIYIKQNIFDRTLFLFLSDIEKNFVKIIQYRNPYRLKSNPMTLLYDEYN